MGTVVFSKVRLILAAVLITGYCALAWSMNSPLEGHLRKTYVGSQQLLRHFYSADALKFDASGNPKNREKEGPWTMLSGVMIDDLRLKSGSLELYGHRQLLVFDEQSKQIRGVKTDEKFRIEIETHNGPDQGPRLEAALARVFVRTEELASIVPDYWQDYMARLTGKLTAGAPCDSSNARTDDENGRPPAAAVSTGIAEGLKIHDAQPGYSAIARAYRVQGGLALRAVIDKAGNVSRVCILQALGAGIDDDMVTTVRQWKYQPYLLNGKPVEIQTTIRAKFGVR
jgi:TonB family protein